MCRCGVDRTQMAELAQSPFKEIRAAVPVHLLPSRLTPTGGVKDGVNEGLNTHLMKYVRHCTASVLMHCN